MTDKPNPVKPYLKPCPFCGGVAVLEAEAATPWRYRVRCGGQFQCVVLPRTIAGSYDWVISQWNQRPETRSTPCSATVSPLQEARDRLRAGGWENHPVRINNFLHNTKEEEADHER